MDGIRATALAHPRLGIDVNGGPVSPWRVRIRAHHYEILRLRLDWADAPSELPSDPRFSDVSATADDERARFVAGYLSIEWTAQEPTLLRVLSHGRAAAEIRLPSSRDDAHSTLRVTTSSPLTLITDPAHLGAVWSGEAGLGFLAGDDSVLRLHERDQLELTGSMPDMVIVHGPAAEKVAARSAQFSSLESHALAQRR